MRKSATAFQIGALLFGFAFLYVPIALLILYSFNASRLVTVWGGFSTRWYVSLLSNEQVLASAWVSLRVGVISALFATILGTSAAIVLSRYGRFRGRFLFSAMIYAPLVMPEVILGLSLLLFFVALIAIGSGLTRPPLFALLQKAAPASERGLTFGVAQSGASLARIIGPIFAGWLYDRHPSWPYVSCAAIALVTGVVAWKRLVRSDALPMPAPRPA